MSDWWESTMGVGRDSVNVGFARSDYTQKEKRLLAT